MSAQNDRLGRAIGRPDASGSVISGADDAEPVGAEHGPVDPLFVPAQHDGFTAVERPDSYGLIEAGGNESSGVRAERDVIHCRVSGQDERLTRPIRAPHSDGSVCCCGRDTRVVGAQGGLGEHGVGQRGAALPEDRDRERCAEHAQGAAELLVGQPREPVQLPDQQRLHHGVVDVRRRGQDRVCLRVRGLAARLHEQTRADDRCDGEHDDDRGQRGGHGLVARDQLLELVGGARRAGQDRLRGQVAADVLRQRRGARVAPVGLLLQRRRGDRLDVGVELPRAAPGLRQRLRIFLADHAHGLGQGLAQHVVGTLPREQLVEHHAEGVDVGPHVDLVGIAARLLGAHVGERALDHADLGRHRRRGHVALGDPRQAEVEDLQGGESRARRDAGHAGGARLRRHDDVRGLEVAVDHAALVRVVHRVGDLAEQAEAEAQLLLVEDLGALGDVLL